MTTRRGLSEVLETVRRRFGGAGSQGNSTEPHGSCGCRWEFEDAAGSDPNARTALRIDANGCPGDGALAASPDCRATAVHALADRDADVVRVTTGGREFAYLDRSLALLIAAGRFVERTRHREPRTARIAARDPLRAAREATGRAGDVERAAAETGLIEVAERAEGYADALRPYVSPSFATCAVATRLPEEATIVDRWETSTGATVRIYEHPGTLRSYHLTPPEAELDGKEIGTVSAARSRLIAGAGSGNGTGGRRGSASGNGSGSRSGSGSGTELVDRSLERAIRAVRGGDGGRGGTPAADLASILRRHTRGYGVLEDVFGDPHVSDAFLTPPVAETPLRVVVDGERLRTNVRLSPQGAATLASRLRRVSGRAFSRASPTLDATLKTGSGPIRVAATTRPVSDGYGFTFRRGGEEAWTLPRLVECGTLTGEAAGLLSVAIERGVAGLVAGGRGAGKTATLGALLWELPAGTRGVVIEDTPELPVRRLQETGRDVQRLSVEDRGDAGEIAPAEAVHTALRLGDGAIVVGEVRGEEAAALYEAMRVGASGETVLGTIHGRDPQAVHERVVTDLGVPETAFASTDLLVQLADHRVRSISEVSTGRDGAVFSRLFERTEDGLVSTSRIEQGTSALVNDLTRDEESYAAVRTLIGERAKTIAEQAGSGETSAEAVSKTVAERGRPDR
jgi:type IV secretory pathway ATPase VirB11/archaellum biosynthesis ATPase